MSTRSYPMLLVCILIFSALPAKADQTTKSFQTTQIRRLIQDAYNKQDAAYDRRDVNGVIAFFAPNWTIGDSSYKVMLHRYEGRDLLENMGAFEKRPFSVVQKITAIHLHGNQAVTTVEMQQIVGPSTRMGYKSPALIMTTIDWDTWEHTPKGWLMTRCYMASGHIK